jgi:Domain of unknown function (DUF4864)
MRARAFWLIYVPALILWLGGVSNAQQAPDVQALISGQLDAFAHDDAAAAFAVAAPGIKQRFQDPDAFMAMVKTAYPPVYHHKTVQFGAQTRDGDQIGQTVVIVDNDNEVWGGVYTLELESDGSWKISGCVLIKSAQSSL